MHFSWNAKKKERIRCIRGSLISPIYKYQIQNNKESFKLWVWIESRKIPRWRRGKRQKQSRTRNTTASLIFPLSVSVSLTLFLSASLWSSEEQQQYYYSKQKLVTEIGATYWNDWFFFSLFFPPFLHSMHLCSAVLMSHNHYYPSSAFLLFCFPAFLLSAFLLSAFLLSAFMLSAFCFFFFASW